MRAHHEKQINLALQGGGAHGAFTWGVLDRLFEDDRLWIEAISGTSAGAMNAVVASQGMYDGQAEGARKALHDFWFAISQAGMMSPLKRSPIDVLMGNWSLDNSPAYMAFDFLQRIASPYDLNPFNINPFRDLVESLIDFTKIREGTGLDVFIAATNVETGRPRIFTHKELNADVVLASACLPFIFHAVEIDGQHYWDGGYMGNPPIFPFYQARACDVAIVQINPIFREGVPRSAREILNRVNEITFNSALMHELRLVDHVSNLVRAGELDASRHREMRLHIIECRKQMRPLNASSKLNTEWAFLRHLFEIGRTAADHWLAMHYDDIGKNSTLDVAAMFDGHGPSIMTPTDAATATAPPGPRPSALTG